MQLKDVNIYFILHNPFPIKVLNNRESLLPPAVDGTLKGIKCKR